MDLERFLCDAARIPGVSGNEARIGAWLAEQFRPLADEVSIDRMQNVIARVGSEGPKVIICAHQDEIGLVVTNIDDDSAIRFYRNGGVDPRILPGLEVEIQTRDGALYGVVGAKAPHLLTREEAGKPVNYETLHIDVGLPADEVRQKVRVGDPIVMLAESQSLANGRMAGKTMDDRASVAAMLIAAEELGRMKVKMQAYFVSTAQEEVGSYGARAAGNGVDPDWAIAIDVTHGEGPGTGAFEAFEMDKLTIERGPFIHRALGKKMEETAEKYHIPYNISASAGNTWTDADSLVYARGGIPSTLVSIPLRYMHTTVETLDTAVIRDSGRLMAMMIADMAEDWEKFAWC